MDSYLDDAEAVRAAVQGYVDACRDADPEMLRAALHPAWTMYGIDSDTVDVAAAPDEFVQWLQDQDSPAGYRAGITRIDVAGHAACATLVEESYYGIDYVVFFTLVRYDGRWQVVTKTYSEVPLVPA